MQKNYHSRNAGKTKGLNLLSSNVATLLINFCTWFWSSLNGVWLCLFLLTIQTLSFTTTNANLLQWGIWIISTSWSISLSISLIVRMVDLHKFFSIISPVCWFFTTAVSVYCVIVVLICRTNCYHDPLCDSAVLCIGPSCNYLPINQQYAALSTPTIRFTMMLWLLVVGCLFSIINIVLSVIIVLEQFNRVVISYDNKNDI